MSPAIAGGIVATETLATIAGAATAGVELPGMLGFSVAMGILLVWIWVTILLAIKLPRG